MDLNKDVDVLQQQFDKLMGQLPDDKKNVVMASIKKMNEAKTPEELTQIRDEEIERVKKQEAQQESEQ